ncbi:MAG: YitT family protein [Eubacterium sp.]|nr:YitT family protein [Eubacterium sp.]
MTKTIRKAAKKIPGIIRESKMDIIWIIAGTLLMAVSVNLFYTPAKMVPGGFSGLAILLKYVSGAWIEGGVPVWMWNFILNVPLILFAVLIRGWKFMSRTFLATVIFTVWLYIIPEYGLASDDLFLIAVIGGGIMGVGLGLVFLGNATTGGTDTVAAIITKLLPHLSIAKILPLLDAVIVLISAAIFGIRVSLYAVITVILSGMIADRIINGFRNAYTAYIISESADRIAETIMAELERGVTKLQGTGMYTKNDRPVLLCAISKKQTVLLKDIVYSIDPDAFVIMTDAQEIRGEGFLGLHRDEL